MSLIGILFGRRSRHSHGIGLFSQSLPRAMPAADRRLAALNSFPKVYERECGAPPRKLDSGWSETTGELPCAEPCETHHPHLKGRLRGKGCKTLHFALRAC